uniref:Uncharacterized protein n=1 Tax=Magallana gigas TaxID=29159 RepID=A0A8W8M538_MAGGI
MMKRPCSNDNSIAHLCLIFISYRKILFPSPTPKKVCHSSLIRRVRIRKASSHDDYMTRIENLHKRLSGMDSGEYSKVKVISTEIGVRSREPCYNVVFTVSFSDLDLHWLHTL